MATDRHPTPEKRARRAAFAGCPLNGDMLQARALIEQLQEVLDRLADHGPEVVLDAWAEAGVPGYDPADADQEAWVHAAEYVPGEASGFAWACNAFLATLQTVAIPLPRGTAAPSAAKGNSPVA